MRVCVCVCMCVRCQALTDLMSYARIPPAVNQVEAHPLNTQVTRFRLVCLFVGLFVLIFVVVVAVVVLLFAFCFFCLLSLFLFLLACVRCDC